ncbi:MAG: DUF6414 family protein [Lactococcus lactis]
MKDYIYVDTDLATSYFAQINRGMISKLLSNETTSDTGTNNGGTEKTGEVAGNLAFASGKYTSKEVDTFSQAFMKSSSEVVENVLHDYLIDMLIDSIETKNDGNYNEGDFIVHTSKIKVFDFGSMKEGISKKTLEGIYSIIPEMKEIRTKISELRRNKSKQQSDVILLKQLEKQVDLSMFDDIGKFIQTLDKFFPDMIIMKIGETISLCSNANLRFPPATLNPINSSTRKVTIFGQVISKVIKDSRELPSDPMEILSKANTVLPEIFLNAINIKKDKEYNVRPIAIYFE